MDVSVGNHRLVLLRHGETEWSRDRKHTSHTDLDLTDQGREQARLAGRTLDRLDLINPVVLSSPRRRALATAQLAGLSIAEISPLLAEWDYGDYEGLTTHEIRTSTPGWSLWTQGCPGGESPAAVSARADDAVAYALDRMVDRDVVFVSHGHFCRSVITRWVEQPLREGARYGFPTAAVAVCGFEYGLRQLSALGLMSHRSPVTGA